MGFWKLQPVCNTFPILVAVGKGGEGAQLGRKSADTAYVRSKYDIKPTVRCHYVDHCYLAEALECYGYKIDCPLYMRSNGEACNDARFHAAMDRLISKTRQKHLRLNPPK